MTSFPSTYTVSVFPPDFIMFQIAYNCGPGHETSANVAVNFGWMNLSRVKDGHVDECTDHAKPAFPAEVAIGTKLSIRLQFEGHPPYNHQANIGRVGRRSQPTRGDLAAFIARGIKRFLENMSNKGTPFFFNGWEVRFEDLYLVGVVLVSKGSVQPVIGIQRMYTV